MASLKPPFSSPSSAVAGTLQLENSSVASGWGAITWIWREASRPGVFASTMKALMPRVPPLGLVLANTQ